MTVRLLPLAVAVALAYYSAVLFAADLGSSGVTSGPLLQARSEVVFEIRYPQTVPGQSVFVLGDRPELGGGDLRQAPRLEPTDFPIWRLSVELPAGVRYRYRFYRRDDAPERLSDGANGVAIAGEVTAQAPDMAIGTHTRRVSAPTTSRFTHAAVLDSDGKERVRSALGASGSYKTAGGLPFEKGDRLRLTGAGSEEVVIRTDAQQLYLSPDGKSATWFPHGSGELSASRIVVHEAFGSAASGNPRGLRVYLPRGYDTLTAQRFPVLYVQDGQNIFRPGGAFGSWDMDVTLDAAIGRGEMPELIVVGIDNTRERMQEYVPPYSAIEGQAGTGDRYARFLVEEVIPFIDSRYRTIPDRDHRIVGGSSLGGLIAAYIAWTQPRNFSRCLCMSGSFWLDEIIERFRKQPDRDLLMYLDSGDAGQSKDGLVNTNRARDALLASGRFRLEGNLIQRIGFGDGHNERAWARRFPEALRAVFSGAELAVLDGDVDGSGRIDAADVEAVRASVTRPDAVDAYVRGRADLDGSATLDDQDIRLAERFLTAR